MKTRCLDLGLPAVALLVLLLAGCTRCDLQSFNEHVEAESKEMLQDPTANYSKFIRLTVKLGIFYACGHNEAAAD